MNEIAKEETPWWQAGWSRHVSPSGLGRVSACIRSEAMPHSASNNAFAQKGTVAHKFLADCLDVGRDLALGKVENPEDIEWLEGIDVERLPAFDPLAYSPELAFAYNPLTRTARELGRNITREQARALADDVELVGIVDVGGCTDELAVCHDYKTGWGYVEAAETNWQLKTYALMMARCYGKTGAFYSVIRVRDNGFVWFDYAQMDELDLLAHEDALIDLLQRRTLVRARARTGNVDGLPVLVEGEHCRYCPALAFCPAKTTGVLALMAEDRAQQAPNMLTPELAAEAWIKVRHAKKTVERFETILKQFARTNPLPLGDGEIVGEKLTPKESVVPEKAKSVLERQYGPVGMAVAGEATEVKTSLSKERLRAALKKLLLPTLPKEDRKITWLERDVLKLLREAGAVSVRVDRSVCEFTPPKKPLLPEGNPPPEEQAEEAA